MGPPVKGFGVSDSAPSFPFYQWTLLSPSAQFHLSALGFWLLGGFL